MYRNRARVCLLFQNATLLDPNHRGMSTTMSAFYVSSGIGIVAQVGDSRVYRWRNGRAEQLTEDHTLVNYKLKHGLITPEEAEEDPGRNVITRAVGHRDYVQVDTSETILAEGDRYLLCSDGLHVYLEENELNSILSGESIESVGEALIDLANDRGGRDNITALIVEILGDESR